ncbi:DNA repair protein rad26 [Apiospora saccharicola]|uniref:DNA repair protein rad26 n=1 Tax=Apiospora saccharicola TaxID=335842 RepID=A0ABR1UKQ3_9PEZI
MDDFSDDGFDELNLDELENNAIQFTQAKRIEPTQDQQAEYDFDDDDDLDAEVVVIDDAPRNQPVVPVNKSFVGSAAARVVPQQTIQQDAWGGPVPVPASHLRNQSYSRPNQSAANLGPRSSQAPAYSQLRAPNGLPRPAPTIPSRYQASQAPHQTGPTPQEVALQAQIRDLQLKLQSKDGEIGIVRTRLERSRQDHDRELQTLKKQTAEQIAKQERAVEAAKAAEKNATTELEFTKRDLREEVVRAKQKDKNGGTPKKNNAAKSWGIADGFDDVEMAGSPSKGTRGRNPGAVASVVAEPPARLTRTPTKPKRKRPPPADSPVMALETTEDDVVMVDHGEDALAGSVANLKEPAPTPTHSHSFDLLKVVLNHCSAYARPLTLDVLAGYSLPSNPSESLASIILQRITAMGDSNDPLRLPIELCQLLIDLWSRCFHEDICDPIVELVSLLSFTVQLSPGGVAPHIAESLITITVECTSEVAIPRVHHNGPGDPTEENFLKYRATIPTTDILSLLYVTALGCETSASIGEDTVSEPIVDFWAYMLVEYVLTLLSPKQAMNDALIMMRLVSTSAFEGTIGPTLHSQRTHEEIAGAIIDRVSFFLMNIQAAGLDDHKLWTIRHTALQTLASIATSPFGMRELAKHKLAIPRLVIFLSWSIDELYDGEKTYNAYRLPPPSPPLTEEDDVFAKLIRAPEHSDDIQSLIAQTMLLLHTIVTDKRNKDFLDVPAKVAGFTGGSQKYLLSLARLNFAEEGVSEETADMARELLELIVTEEQGAELGEFFGG